MPSPHNHPDITTSSTEHYLRADHAHARHPQQREYLTTRISTIYDLLKTLRHAPHQS